MSFEEENKSLTKIIEKTIENNDPYWVEPIKKIVIKIMEMEEGAESSISNLLGEDIHNYTSKQLFDIDKSVSEVCLLLNIKLDRSGYKNKTVGLPYAISFIKQIK